jgi:uncharacterized protein (DUF427 family)
MPFSFNPAAPNPFLANPPVVQVVRHVRVTTNGEVVAEDSQKLKRFLQRSVQPRIYPQRLVTAPGTRQFPNVGVGNLKTTL